MARSLLVSAAAAGVAVASGGPSTTVTILHITDVHIDPYYTIGTLAGSGCYCTSHDACPRFPTSCAHTDNASLAAPPFGSPEDSCATPIGLWEAAMSFVPSLAPAMVFYTGDFNQAGLAVACSASSSAQEQQLSNTNNAFAALRAVLPGVPIYAVYGNHDRFVHHRRSQPAARTEYALNLVRAPILERGRGRTGCGEHAGTMSVIAAGRCAELCVALQT